MKNLIITLSLVNVMNIYASDCLYKVSAATGAVFVPPSYETSVTYFFDPIDKKGIAQVSWGPDEKMTTDCLELVKGRYPNLKVVVSTIRVRELAVSVLGGNVTKVMPIYPQADGQYFGMVSIPMDFEQRKEVAKAVGAKQKTVTLTGDIGYRMSVIERKVVEYVNCIDGIEDVGVMSLYKRLGEMVKIISGRRVDEKINRDEVLEEFLGQCVEFQDVNASSLTELDAGIRRTSRFNLGKVAIKGDVRIDVVEPMAADTNQTSTISEI